MRDKRLVESANSWLDSKMFNENDGTSVNTQGYGPVHDPALPPFSDTQTPGPVNTEKPVETCYRVCSGRQDSGTPIDNYGFVMALNLEDAREKGAKLAGQDPMSLDFNVESIVDAGILEKIKADTEAMCEKMQASLKTLGPCIAKMKEY